MALGDYVKTTYNDGAAPGISAARLNNHENKTAELDTAVTAHLADDVKHITATERTTWNNKLDASNSAVIAGNIYAYKNLGGGL